MNVSLAQRTAVITGAGSGINRATVLRFLQAGVAGVVAVDRTPGHAESLRSAIPAPDHHRIETVVVYAYLASDRATFFPGATLMLDGGYTAR